MPRGSTNTIKDAATLPAEASKIAKWNATTADLERARQKIGELAPRTDGKASCYRYAGFQLDDLSRLIAQLELVQ